VWGEARCLQGFSGEAYFKEAISKHRHRRVDSTINGSSRSWFGTWA